jgi:peptidoglycan/xylan/chitin deacetylase (PgdA/CDA1 family)
MTEARTWTTWARRLGTLAMRSAWARRAALRVARARGRGLVLVYHRVSPDGPAPHEVVRSLPSALFAQQLHRLRQMGVIVPLPQLPAALAQGDGPYFAITFDDDHSCHRQHALAVLETVGAHATFFLSGRVLHGVGPYWWSLVEESIRVRGLESTRKILGLTGATPADLAIALEGSALIDQLDQLLPLPGESQQQQQQQQPPMRAEDIGALTAAGMTVGFHTLRHPVLTTLSGEAREIALTEGREALAAAAGAPVDLLAYPHGLANAAVADAAERAGFRAAYAAGGRPITARSDPFLLGRWDPGFLEGEAFTAALALRLSRPATPARHRRPIS